MTHPETRPMTNPMTAPAKHTHIADWDERGYPEYQVQIGSQILSSEDGDEWLDGGGAPAAGTEFQGASILLRGGPRDGTVVG